ncbi:positive regulation of dendritic spine morphogenesis [Mactra antiquata]
MPSASTKVEIPASSEASDPFKKVLTVVDKKVRNLEKRKLKLDSYRQKRDSGAELEKDQQIAVDKYGEVVQNLEFARELQKQFQGINTDNEKVLKKQAKREKLEKQIQDIKRVKEVLQLQTLLDNMGSDSVRKDFQTGKHGAIVLTEENLEQIDEFYKLINPTRESSNDFQQELGDASEHIVCLLDSKEKAVVGTTYKDLKELLDLISNCGYFEKVQSSTTEPSTETGDVEFEVVEHKDVPAPDSEEVQSSLPPEITLEDKEPDTLNAGQQLLNNDTLNTQQPVMTAQADVFFTAVTSQALEQQQQQQQQTGDNRTPFNQQTNRPFQEIVSAVQGSFNFLQESTIDEDAKREFSPHMDPAVVAAHPMPQSQQTLGRPSSTQNPDASSMQPAGYGGASSFGEQSSLDTDLSSKVPHGASVDQSVFSQANAAPSQNFTGSGFAQSNLTHSLQTDNLFSGAVAGTDSSSGNISMLGKSDNSTISHSQYDIPPQLPMPPGHDQTQDGQQQSDVEKKGYPMNPNATEFQSLIYNQSGAEDADSTSKSNTEGFQGGSYSNNGYNQGPREQRSGRGGFRGNRGGNRGSSNMSNGYSRGGRGNYQNYQQRSDYRSDNYQSYSGGSGNNSYNNGSNFQKRTDGGRGGSGRGGNRGGPRGGFNRGGSGGPRGGSTRSGGQGFGRPNFNQQQP